MHVHKAGSQVLEARELTLKEVLQHLIENSNNLIEWQMDIEERVQATKYQLRQMEEEYDSYWGSSYGSESEEV